MERSMERLLELAQPVGLTEDTLDLLRLLPLVYVAWSDGEVQAEELEVIVESAERLGVDSESALDVLEGWLSARPDEAFFKQGLKVLSYLVASLPESEAAEAADDVAALCAAVAAAAGGLTGHTHRTDAREQLALRDVANRLNLGARPASRKALRGILLAGD